MSFTSLRVVEAGVVLYAQHEARFSSSAASLEAFRAFAAVAEPGVWSLRFTEGVLHVERRPGSRLADGQPVRFVVSPFSGKSGSFAKPTPPSRYDDVRLPGVATLLTTDDGGEILESCVASVVAWDGAGLVVVPDDRPRVASSAEVLVRATLPVRSAPVLVGDAWPLLLVNAVRTAVPELPGRQVFPVQQRHALEAAIEATARRP